MSQDRIFNFEFQAIFGKTVDVVDNIIANKESHVHRFTIPKRDGTQRTILAPDSELKFVEKMVYYKLLKRYSYSEAANGFIPKRGIVTNAIPHVGANSVGKIDIAKFFDSISVDHLKNCLFGNKNVCRFCKNYTRMLDGKCHPSLYKNKVQSFEYRCEEIKAIFIPNYCEETGYQSLFKRVIEVCTYNGFTAQGFPTSPMLANIVMRGFDKSIIEHCKDNNITYTRYADDLAFSSTTLTATELMEKTKKKAYALLWAYNFKPKREKTRYRSKGTRLKICGIVVNQKPSVQKSVVKRFRAKVHHAIYKFPDRTTKSRIRSLKGWASFLMSVDKTKGEKYMGMLKRFEDQKFPKPVEV
jgi:RNA-directed DNA polymerase